MITQGRRVCIHGGHVWTGKPGAGFAAGGLMLRDGVVEAVLSPGELPSAVLGADEVIDLPAPY